MNTTTTTTNINTMTLAELSNAYSIAITTTPFDNDYFNAIEAAYIAKLTEKYGA